MLIFYSCFLKFMGENFQRAKGDTSGTQDKKKRQLFNHRSYLSQQTLTKVYEKKTKKQRAY